jgi:hypothetical protein
MSCDKTNVLLTIYWDNNMFDNSNFYMINIHKDLCMNLLLNKNDPFMYS